MYIRIYGHSTSYSDIVLQNCVRDDANRDPNDELRLKAI